MNHIGTQTIETERLILRRFTIDDAQDMFNNYANSEKVCEFLTWKPHGKIENTLDYLENFVIPQYDNLNTYRWAIVLKSTNQVIGAIDVVEMSEKSKRAEIGWVLGEDYWGNGYMPEAGREVLKVLFEVGFERIQAKHDVRNPKSGRAMQKIGMHHEGTLKKYGFNSEGELIDCELYAICK